MENLYVLVCFGMVRIRTGVMTNSSSARRRDHDTRSVDSQRVDHLEDTALYIPPISHQLSVGESSRL
jgi:hypothetical protein